MSPFPRGRRQMEIYEDGLVRRGVELWLERVLGYYGEDGGVDIEVIDEQVALTKQTAEYLYTNFTPTEIKYVAGSRPMLEGVVKQLVRADMSDRTKALVLMRRVRDNQDMGLARPGLFDGGDEEDLLKRGARMCNEVSRLYACLCQVAGLPARLHSAHISGHMMTEVLIDGKWVWIDSMKGMAPVNDRDEPASAWELTCDPTLFERQPKSVWEDCRPAKVVFGTQQRDPRNLALAMVYYRDCYFNPREAQAIGNYFVWEHERYTFPWRIEPVDAARLASARHEEALNRMKLGWPAFYFNHLCLEEGLKMRG